MQDEHHIRDTSEALFSPGKLPVQAVRFTTGAGLLIVALASGAMLLTHSVPTMPAATNGATAPAPARPAKAG